MRKRMKKRLGWIVLAVIAVFVVIFFIVILLAANGQKKLVVLDAAREQKQIEAFLDASVTLYIVGQKEAAARLIEYAVLLIMERERRTLTLLPAEMLKDPLIARKVGLKRGTQTVSHRFGGG